MPVLAQKKNKSQVFFAFVFGFFCQKEMQKTQRA
jgi:hypothetical protein